MFAVRHIIVLGTLVSCILGQSALASAMPAHGHRGWLGEMLSHALLHVWQMMLPACSGCAAVGKQENSSQSSPPQAPTTFSGLLRRALEMQREVYEATVRLDRLTEPQRGQVLKIAAPLLGETRKIVADLDKWILVLREDGTSVGLIAAPGEVRDDLRQVADRLAEGNVGKITQSIEIDITKALEDIVDAMGARTRKGTPTTPAR